VIQIDLLSFRIRDIMRTMGKKKHKKQWNKATLAEVTKEMAKPRVARSARQHSHVFPEDITRLRQASRGEPGWILREQAKAA
jgi:hypothetical protein